MLQINLGGYESPGILRALKDAFEAYVKGATEEFIARQEAGYSQNQQTGNTQNALPDPTPAPAAEVAGQTAEVLPAEKPKRKPRAPAADEVKSEPEETKTVDNSAVMAAVAADDAKEARRAERAAAEQASEPQAAASEGTGKEVSVVDIRAMAKAFNTDALRAAALEILHRHDAKSVTDLEKRDNVVRVSVMDSFRRLAEDNMLPF